jgi:hypothetical protein
METVLDTVAGAESRWHRHARISERFRASARPARAQQRGRRARQCRPRGADRSVPRARNFINAESLCPPFKDALAQEQIWQIITYMRASFPAVSATGKE